MTTNKYRILIADDNPTFAKTLSIMVKTILGNNLGHVDFAFNGQEAVNMAFHYGVYDLIFMDITMPEMDGITATTIINKVYYRETKIIAVSFMKDINMVIKMLESGASKFIYKDKLTIESIEKVFDSTLNKVN